MRDVRELPPAPAFLELAVDRLWDGGAPPQTEQRAWVRLGAEPGGLRVAVGMAHQRPARIPDAPVGARVDGLWRYDVVECFVVAADGRYLELELGAGGHQLVLAFAAARERTRDFAAAPLALTWRRDAAGWSARCTLPRAWIPEPVVRVNAFAIGGGVFLAHAPVGGAEPDFHRPAAYPRVRIPSWE